MDLHLYDNYTRSLRKFTPLKAESVGLYSCGPTVYDYPHIGNLRTYLFVDGLKRVLRWNSYKLEHVMNITDVGHLTSDADTGEDRMEKGSRRTGKSAWEIAALYTQAFRDDLNALNIEEPDVWCKATDHIREQIEFIADIEKKGFTYRTSDGLYFDTSKQPDYGFLARLDKAGLVAGKRVAVGEKRNPTDFALWKFSAPGEKRQMEWPSPWGIGFPGWHIECSAMAQKYLGDYFDIHCGGEDHIPVHHTNEIAQTEARVGTRLANFWLHGYFLLLNDERMAKSAGEFLRLQVLMDKGFDPMAYRYLCLTAHYRSQLSFTWQALEAAQIALGRLRTQAHALHQAQGVQADAAFIQRFGEQLNNDLNFPRALVLVWELLKGALDDSVKRATLFEFDRCLGLGLSSWHHTEEPSPQHIVEMADLRQKARQEKNWQEADRLRQVIRAEGYEVEDTADGYRLKKL